MCCFDFFFLAPLLAVYVQCISILFILISVLFIAKLKIFFFLLFLLPLVQLNGLNFLFLLWIFSLFLERVVCSRCQGCISFCDEVISCDLNILSAFSTNFGTSNLTLYSVNSVYKKTLNNKKTKQSLRKQQSKNSYDWLASYLIFVNRFRLKFCRFVFAFLIFIWILTF